MITGYYSIHVFRTVVDSLACEGPRTSPGVQQTEPHKPVQLRALSLGRWSSPLAIKMQSVRRPFTTLSPNQDRFTAGQMSCSERLMSVASSHATGNTWSLGLSTVPLYYEGRLDRSAACILCVRDFSSVQKYIRWKTEATKFEVSYDSGWASTRQSTDSFICNDTFFFIKKVIFQIFLERFPLSS